MGERDAVGSVAVGVFSSACGRSVSVCIVRFLLFLLFLLQKNSKKCTMYQSSAQYPNKQDIELED